MRCSSTGRRSSGHERRVEPSGLVVRRRVALSIEVGAPAGRRPQRRPAPSVVAPTPIESARSAGLRYVNDGEPGIVRRRAGKGFSFRDARGHVVKDAETLARIRHLAIPPAWTEVWICRSDQGHIQATGRDARGRKQYRYHPRWREVRDETKYDRMLAFGAALPAIRAQTERDLALPGLPRAKVLATVVRLLEQTLVRVGNEEYARNNKSFGLTTLQDEHVDVHGDRIRFHFRGKSGRERDLTLRDRRLAHIVKRCQDLPGHELFQYVDGEGETQRIHSEDVNEYLRAVAGQEFTAKDFRTWAGSVLCASLFCETEVASSIRQARQCVAKVIDVVSARLGNTRAVCQRCYVHPAVIGAYVEGVLQGLLELSAPAKDPVLAALSPDEARMLRIVHAFGERAVAPPAASRGKGVAS